MADAFQIEDLTIRGKEQARVGILHPLRWTKLYEKNIGNSEGLDIDDDLDESEADNTFEDSAGDDSR